MARRKQQLSPWQAGILLLILLAVYLYQSYQPGEPGVTVPPGDYLFCFWNVENFFDDQDDDRNRIDNEYDNWFAEDKSALRLKLDKLTEPLLAMNGGKGPDVLALVEVESTRAAALLKEALNAKLPQGAVPYDSVLFEEVKVGRHIAPAILTRLPVVHDRTVQYDKRRRILEGRIRLNGKDLIVVASHWTSRLEGGEDGRAKYADLIYGEYKAKYLSNPDVDVLVCGDFNDTPDDVSVTQHLHATGDRQSLPGTPDPLLFNLMAGKDPKQYGTHYYSGWLIFDQVAVSPGMLDRQGWACDPQSVRAVRTLTRPGDKVGRPWRFGSRTDEPNQRGYADHFPVTVTLSLDGGVAAAPQKE